MAAIRHVRIQNFRGFVEFSTPLPCHAVLVGEPGAGRSDLIEAVIRTLDPEALRRRQATELDISEPSRGKPATVEVTIGDLSESARSSLFNQLEFWDRESELVVTEMRAGMTP